MFINETELYIFMDVVIAATLTMFVGIEREKAEKAAGIRTNMIVGAFTCLMVSLIYPLIDYVEVQHDMDVLATDPIRVLEAIVVGISFIGAGTIIKTRDESSISGITTGATLLYSGGIGISIALHNYLLAVLLTAFILIINSIIRWFVKKFTSIKN